VRLAALVAVAACSSARPPAPAPPLATTDTAATPERCHATPQTPELVAPLGSEPIALADLERGMGRIRGRVLDAQTCAPAIGAIVALIDRDGGHAVYPGSDGLYSFEAVAGRDAVVFTLADAQVSWQVDVVPFVTLTLPDAVMSQPIVTTETQWPSRD
jgi:hypothetical protein